jgi:hypothetical protein
MPCDGTDAQIQKDLIKMSVNSTLKIITLYVMITVRQTSYAEFLILNSYLLLTPCALTNSPTPGQNERTKNYPTNLTS